MAIEDSMEEEAHDQLAEDSLVVLDLLALHKVIQESLQEAEVVDCNLDIADKKLEVDTLDTHNMDSNHVDHKDRDNLVFAKKFNR